MKKTSFFAAIAACTLLFAACKKDEKPTNLLSGSTCWKQVKSESRTVGTDAWGEDELDACILDDCTSYTDDGKVNFDEGATKCDPSDPQTSSGTYSLSDDGKTLTVTQLGVTTPFTLEDLTSSKMVIVVYGVFGIYDIRSTLEAQ